MTEIKELMQHVKDVRIHSIDLETSIGNIGLQNMFSEIQIFEDIYSPAISMNISLSESRNIPELANLRGGEKLTLKWKTAGYNSYTTLEMYLDSVSSRVITKDNHAVYTMHFVTRETIYNSIRKISRSYSNDILSTYIEDILTNDSYGCSSNKPLEKEESLQFHKIVVPMWSPFQTIQWMKNRCVSSLYPGSPFFFFENKQSFVLSSMERLFNQPTDIEYIYSPKTNYETRNLEEEFRKVESYSVNDTIEFLKRLESGAQASKLITFDLVTKKFIGYNFSYENNDTRNLISAQQSEIDTPLSFENIDLSKEYNSSRLFSYKSSEIDEGNNHVEEWAASNVANISNLESICLQIQIPGDSQLEVGGTINFTIPSYAANDTVVPDKILSGKYLITAIAHYIKRESYEMSCEICKDSFYRQLSGNTSNFLS